MPPTYDGESRLGSTKRLPSVPQKIPPLQTGGGYSAGQPKGSPSVHLDALRGFAAFSVLMNHWRDAFFVDYKQLSHHDPITAAAYLASGLGHQWVIVFFVMSGYLVGGSVLRAVRADRWSWRSYLLARLTRLYVVLLPALLLGGILDWTGIQEPGTGAIYSGQSGMHALVVDVHKTLTFPTLAGNLLFLQTIALPGLHGITVPAFGSNGPLWSLSNEFWYYMAFPLLVLLVARGRALPTRVSCGLGILLWGWFVGSGIALLGISWLMGALIAGLPPVPSSRSWVRGLAMLAAFAMFATGLVLGKQHEGALVFDLILGVSVTFLIWVTLHYATAPLPSAYVGFAQRAARSSYTLYLVHLPLVIFLKASLHIERAAPGWHMFLVAAAILLGAVVYAQLVYQLFERNTDRIRSYIKPHVPGGQTA